MIKNSIFLFKILQLIIVINITFGQMFHLTAQINEKNNDFNQISG